mgnify:CR=1 FL=1
MCCVDIVFEPQALVRILLCAVHRLIFIDPIERMTKSAPNFEAYKSNSKSGKCSTMRLCCISALLLRLEFLRKLLVQSNWRRITPSKRPTSPFMYVFIIFPLRFSQSAFRLGEWS